MNCHKCGEGFLSPTLKAIIAGGGGKETEGEEKTVNLEMADGDQIVTPTKEGTLLSKVTIEKPSALVPENIVAGANIGGVEGSAVVSDFDVNGLIARTAEDLTVGTPTIGDYAFYNYTGLKTFTDNATTKIGAHAFDGCTKLATVKIPNASEFGDYAFQGNQYITTLETAAEISSIGAYAIAGLPRLTRFNGVIKGTVGEAGMNFLTAIEDASFIKNSTITSIGERAFSALGASRKNSSVRMTIDFRKSTFPLVPDKTFSQTKNVDIYLPESVTQIKGQPFYNVTDTDVYMGGSAPTLVQANIFESAKNYAIYVPWEYGASYNTATNWTALADKIFAIAEAGTFTAGETLPEYSGEGYAVTWYTDAEKTNAVTVCPEGSPMLYCSYGDAKVKEVVSISTSGPMDITVTDDTGVAVDFSPGYFLCNSGDEFSVNASTSEAGYTYYIKVDGEKVTTFPYALTVTSDVTVTGTAYDPMQINPDFESATPQELKNAVDQGIAATTYAVGATKQITLKNGQLITLRLANNTTDLYERAGESGTTGFVLEFVECFETRYYMNSTNTNAGGWNACYMRTTVMPLILAQLPDEWQEVVATVKIKAGNGYSTGNVVIKSDDKLFLPAEREIFASRGASAQTEWNALTRWQWYTQHDTSEDRIKTFNGSANEWWTRSSAGSYSNYFCLVSSGGYEGTGNSTSRYAVAPAFCI